MQDSLKSGRKCWEPKETNILSSNMSRFSKFAEQRIDTNIDSYETLWKWSVSQRADFWEAVWDFFQVRASFRGEQLLVNGDAIEKSRWFPDARLNFAENLLNRRDGHCAITFWNELGFQERLTYEQLYEQTSRLSEWFRFQGIRPGDRIAVLLPNIPQAVIVMLAAASLGATFSSCSPDFGVAGILDRFGQINPRILFVADGYLYGGKSFETIGKAQQVLNGLPSIEKCVLIPYLDPNVATPQQECWTRWSKTLVNDLTELTFAQLPFDHPLYVLYSSGTTGVPKCIVHGCGGTLLQHLKEHALHVNIGPDDTVFYFTTLGWMMWNWLVSALALGSTIVLYDGSPFHPSENVLWDMVDSEGISVFGASAKYISALQKAGAHPRGTHKLETLHTILSTGSPLMPDSFEYVYRCIKRDVCLSSISGGTDIVSCFVLGNPTLPVFAGEIQCKGLGMQVEVFDDVGTSVVGQKGELVCTASFPSMPVGFMNDPDGSRYHRAYFARYPGVWHHGDYAELTTNGGMVIYGRSDAVLNPGGVRIGTSEIYRQVEFIPEVVESVAVGQRWDSDVRIVLFVRLRDGINLDDELVKAIKSQIRSGASPRHVPAKIVQVADIPRTRSNKIVELAVSDVVHGRQVKNVEAIANAESLAFFQDRPELAAE